MVYLTESPVPILTMHFGSKIHKSTLIACKSILKAFFTSMHKILHFFVEELSEVSSLKQDALTHLALNTSNLYQLHKPLPCLF